MTMHYSAMSGRFILALAGVALLIPFFFLALLFSFAQVGRQLFTDACWAAEEPGASA